MNKINCLVVDDEELARALLENYIGRLPHLAVAGLCKDPLEALQTLQSQPVDLLFLDIQMPGLTGVEFLRTLHQKPITVFTSAYPDYALEGYSLDVTDYLLKPFSFERFVQAVNKASDLIRLKNAPLPTTAAAPPPAAAERDFILVKADHKVHRLRFEDIHYIESMREYVAWHTEQGRILSLNSLKNLEQELPASQFVRIHKSYMVPTARIGILEGSLLHVGKEKLPIGASYREEIVRRFFGA